jgi:hypothetical protein
MVRVSRTSPAHCRQRNLVSARIPIASAQPRMSSATRHAPGSVATTRRGRCAAIARRTSPHSVCMFAGRPAGHSAPSRPAPPAPGRSTASPTAPARASSGGTRPPGTPPAPRPSAPRPGADRGQPAPRLVATAGLQAPPAASRSAGPCLSCEDMVARSKVLFPSSWPDVSRLSALREWGVDGRDTPGHDGEAMDPPHLAKLAPMTTRPAMTVGQRPPSFAIAAALPAG